MNLLETIKAKLQELFISALAPMIEVEVKKQIESESGKVVDFILAKITTAIPGDFDDKLADSIKPKLKEDFKAFLLQEADKISDKV